MSFEDDINTALQFLNLLVAEEKATTHIAGDFSRDTFEGSIVGAMSELDQMLAGQVLLPPVHKPVTTIKPKKVIGLPPAPVEKVVKVERPEYQISEGLALNLQGIAEALGAKLNPETDPLDLQRTIRNIEYAIELLEKYAPTAVERRKWK